MTTRTKKVRRQAKVERPSDKMFIHASSAYVLMMNKQGTGITEKQLQKIQDLQNKKNEFLQLTDKESDDLLNLSEKNELTKTEKARLDKIKKKGRTLKKLTAKEQEELERLIAKRDAPFELSETAKKYIRKLWLYHELGYQEPDVITNELLKGKICEQDSIAVADRQLPSKSFRIANRKPIKKGRFTGKPDVILDIDQIVDEIKTSYSLRTHLNAKDLDARYFGQRQVYMWLTGIDVSRLIRVLVSTPEVLLKSERSKIWNKLRMFEDTEFEKEYFEDLYQKEVEKLERMHNVDHIPEDQRIKVHTTEFDSEYMKEMNRRSEVAADYYDTITLADIDEF